jgi:hypothetical protein
MPNPILPNSEPSPSTSSSAAAMPSDSAPATPQKFWSIEPNANRSRAAMLTPATGANTTAAANLVHASRVRTSSRTIAGTMPASVIGSAVAASPTPRGSSAVSGARSCERSGIPVFWAMPVPSCPSTVAIAGLPPVAVSRVGPCGPTAMPP